MCAASLVSLQWLALSRLDEFWKKFYQEKWLTLNIIQSLPDRTWKAIFSTRMEMECKYVKPCQDSPHCPKLTPALSEAEFRYQQFLFAGETLRSKAYELYTTENKATASLLLQIACEEFASALHLKKNSPEVCLKYGSVTAQCARSLTGNESDRLFAYSFDFYERAAVPDFFMYEHALAFWGDALVDLASKKEGNEAEMHLLGACAKLEESARINPDNSMTQYYWGRALHRLASKAVDPEKKTIYFLDATSKLQRAADISPSDVYILNEFGATLHEFALGKGGEDADRFFQQAAEKYTQAFEQSNPKDAWILRKWADTYYDWAKAKYAENFYQCENGNFGADLSARIQSLLRVALEKYEEALSLDPKNINALNSGALAASTLAKLVEEEREINRLFTFAYERFQRAIDASPSDCSIEKCNWAMVLTSEAMRRRELLEHQQNCGSPRIPSSPQAVSQTIGAVAFAPQHPVVESLFERAKQTLQPLIDSGDKWASFCMARVCACVGDPPHEQQCQYWLEECLDQHYLQKASFWQLAYFEKVKTRSWFQKFKQ